MSRESIRRYSERRKSERNVSTAGDRGLDRHREEALVEDIQFLLVTCKMHPDLAAKRLGLNRDTMEKKLERSKVGKRDTSGEPKAGQG